MTLIIEYAQHYLQGNYCTQLHHGFKSAEHKNNV